MKFKEFVQSMESKIKNSYEEGVTVASAELLAGEFLYAQTVVSAELKKADLDRRMKKTGAKAVRAAVRLSIIQEAKEKKPTEGTIEAMLDTDELVTTEQNNFDAAEVEKEELERLFSVFNNAHIYYRGISKGKFD